jgi:hypothetical protein
MRAAVGNHLQKTTAGVFVLGVLLQMECEFVDALAQNSNLHLSRAGIRFVDARLLYNCRLFTLSKHTLYIAQPFGFCKPQGPGCPIPCHGGKTPFARHKKAPDVGLGPGLGRLFALWGRRSHVPGIKQEARNHASGAYRDNLLHHKRNLPVCKQQAVCVGRRHVEGQEYANLSYHGAGAVFSHRHGSASVTSQGEAHRQNSAHGIIAKPNELCVQWQPVEEVVQSTRDEYLGYHRGAKCGDTYGKDVCYKRDDTH